MLREIRCDEFRNEQGVREPIVFHPGLNAVIGNQSGTNSVGKSTFLMIIDFVFGGDDYIKKSKEVHRNVLPHTIYFKFVFGEEEYFFGRSTDDATVVSYCDQEYKKQEEWKLAKFHGFLASKYGLTEYGMTLRGVMGRSFRIDRRETMDDTKPFQQAKGEPDRTAIDGILKLFGKYSGIHDLEKAAAEAEDAKNAFIEAQRYAYIPFVRTQREYRENSKRIAELRAEEMQLAERSSQGLLDLDSLQAEQLKEVQRKLSGFRRQRTRFRSQLDSIGISKEEGKKTFQQDYEELCYFFPGIDVSRLEQVEAFHKRLASILQAEIKASSRDIEAMIDLATQQIEQLEAEQLKITRLPNVSKAVLEQYAAIQKELQKYLEANESYDQRIILEKRAQEMKTRLDETILDEMARITLRLNTRLEEFNNYIYDNSMKPPIVIVESASKYTYSTPDDGGTGIRYKGLIIFDLALLWESVLPAIAHDSVLLLQIEKEAVEKILELYAKTAELGKQVFIAFDKEATPRGMEILQNAKRLHLSRGGNELFGRSWNRREKEEAKAESLSEIDEIDASVEHPSEEQVPQSQDPTVTE